MCYKSVYYPGHVYEFLLQHSTGDAFISDWSDQQLVMRVNYYLVIFFYPTALQTLHKIFT